jgi:hypothetical protein
LRPRRKPTECRRECRVHAKGALRRGRAERSRWFKARAGGEFGLLVSCSRERALPEVNRDDNPAAAVLIILR